MAMSARRLGGAATAAAIAALLALASGCGAAPAPQTTTVRCATKAGARCAGRAGALRATIVPSTHSPVVNRKWPLEVGATVAGKPAKASAVYDFLYGSLVVSAQHPFGNKHFTFTGTYHDNLVFPADSLGEPIALEVVVATGADTVKLIWSIKAVR